MKITSKRGIHNTDNSVGFINIEDWKGAEMTINTDYMKNMLQVIDNLGELGLDVEKCHIGIAPLTEDAPGGLFCVFLDPNKTVAYAIAGKTEE